MELRDCFFRTSIA